jgi:tetratricopeptide (TPR) repeat protein
VGGAGGTTGEPPAVRALHLVTADPRQARTLALATRRQARRDADRDTESTAERALGLAARELRDARAALGHLRQAVRVAERAGLAQRAAEARMSLALVLAEAGRPTQALREIDAAAPALDGLPAARLQMQRALALDRLSRFTEAMAGYSAALTAFRRAGDRLWQARALTNRGVLHAYQGRLRQAEADLLAAERGYTELGQDLAVAQVRHNLGFVAARAGDVPTALRWYDLADAHFARTGRPEAIALMDRGELLLRAHLLPEAGAAAEAALAAARASRMGLFEAQARLMLADVAISGGDRATARAQAAAARRTFLRQGRPAWAALARYTALRAAGDPGPARHPALRAARDPASARHRRQASEVAAELAETGWLAAALDARLYAASLAVGRTEAGQELPQVLAATRRGPAELRARAWHVVALLRDASGDVPGARRALLAGTRILDEHRATLGATELRTLAAGYATELAATGLRMALRTSRARSVLWWAERWKAAALRFPPTRPPEDAELAADLAELRRLVADVDPVTGPHRSNARWREQRALEDRIRRRSWHRPRAGGGPRPPALLAGLAAQLGERTLVELVDADGDLYAVVVHRGGFGHRRLGRTAEAAAELGALRFALRRIVHRHGQPASRAANTSAARLAAEKLDLATVAAVRGWLGAGELVVVPVGALHATPWALLPSCRGRPVTVAPSASAWLAAAVRGSEQVPAGRRAVLVAGPGLPYAETEVRHLAGLVAPADLLVGPAARVDPVLAALDGAGLAHLAAHGVFRADNPMFSHLRLADGPLTVYDLERLARPPTTVVMSACNSGLSAVQPGEELMGLAAALLGLGTVSVLGSVLPAQDEAALALMTDLHRRLSAGSGPAAALAAAQAAAGEQLDERTATAAAFVCFGAG